MKHLIILAAIALFLSLPVSVAFGQNTPVKEITLKPELSQAGTIKYTSPYFVLIQRSPAIRYRQR